jgi:hypothetical protein
MDGQKRQVMSVPFVWSLELTVWKEYTYVTIKDSICKDGHRGGLQLSILRVKYCKYWSYGILKSWGRCELPVSLKMKCNMIFALNKKTDISTHPRFWGLPLLRCLGLAHCYRAITSRLAAGKYQSNTDPIFSIPDHISSISSDVRTFKYVSERVKRTFLGFHPTVTLLKASLPRFSSISPW